MQEGRGLTGEKAAGPRQGVRGCPGPAQELLAWGHRSVHDRRKILGKESEPDGGAPPTLFPGP